MTTIVNLTPHDIKIVQGDNDVRVFPKPCNDSDIVRVATTDQQVGNIDGVVLFDTVFGDCMNVPPQVDGVVYIVSALAKQVLKDAGRRDFVSPYGLVRDDDGNIIGSQGLCL